ncbi:hypothetical protein GGP72_002968 [Salinibacter ruber]|nr:hypothetical protein [Salinibacter ruber]MCS3682308.1 hypothetical protein [Salinibacter ruber]
MDGVTVSQPKKPASKSAALVSTGPMASVTLKGLPDSVKEQIEEMADQERRSEESGREVNL